MALPAGFLEELRARTPLPALIGRRVRLTRSGRQWKGCCPFHGEKTPSLYVYEDGHYHCFGCGAHGDAIGFLMQSEGLSFLDAVKQLAGEAGLSVPGSGPDWSGFESDQTTRLSTQAQDCSLFKDGGIEAFLATAARIMVYREHVREASILANGQTTLVQLDSND